MPVLVKLVPVKWARACPCVHQGARAALALASLVGAAAMLSSCGSPPPPPAPPPPPPPVVVREPIPPRPVPPENASPNLTVPPLGPDGLRSSVDRGISPAQALWNLRSAWNVAALDCPQPQYAGVQDSYRAFLRANARTLTATNRQVDAEFRKQYGAHFVTQREAYMTGVYNHFALPPTMGHFCDAVAAMSRDAANVKSADLPNFAQNSLPSIDIVFDQFYDQYDTYRAAAAAWDAKYAAPAQQVMAVDAGVPSSHN